MKTKDDVLADFKGMMAVVDMIGESGSGWPSTSFSWSGSTLAIDAIKEDARRMLWMAVHFGILDENMVEALEHEHDL